MKAIIISLNSVIDYHYYLDEFNLNTENFIALKKSFAAGKGINIAKVLNVLKAQYGIFLLLGKENKDEFKSLLSCEKISPIEYYIDGKTRVNISIHAQNICETRLCENNFHATDKECIKLFENAYSSAENEDIVVFSGRLPIGISKKCVIENLRKFREKNVKIILDSASFDAEDFAEIKPYLIKPNEDEMKKYGNSTEESIKKLFLYGVENIAFSKGEKGITLYNKKNVISVVPESIETISTVGAGDSSVAGFIFGLINQYPMDKTLKLAVSCGTANCLSQGGISPTAENIKKCFKNIKMTVEN